MAISKRIIIFLLFLIIFPFARNFPGLGVLFAGSDGKMGDSLVISGAYEGVYGKKLNLDEVGVHILLHQRTSSSEKGDFFYGFIPYGNETILISRIPRIPFCPGSLETQWLKCNYRIVQRHAGIVNSRCRETRPVQVDLYRHIHSVIEEKRLSIYDGMGESANTGNLYIIYVEKSGKKHFFQMLPPAEFLDYFEPKNFVTEYIELYDGLSKLIMTGFEDCRWSNLGNASELMTECKELSGCVFFDKNVLRQVEEDAR